MANTTNLGLPLIQAAQAQKHITVNEALVRLDGLAQLVLLSRVMATPPLSATDGQCWAVPTAASGAWATHAGEIAIYSNGGWVFATPALGWSAYIEDEGARALFDGFDWVAGAQCVSTGGAASIFEAREISHTVASGAVSTTTAIIPAGSVVFGVSGVVSTDITGTLASWELGVSGSSNRYGSGMGLAAGSFVSGLTGNPLAYYADAPLELTATGGDFSGGAVTLVVHLFRMTTPRL
ncbi:MAG: DUF2793 domain-containing protein [Pseudomonadota bacterium]